MAKSFRFPRWEEKTRTYSIHPVAFIDQPVATPHQPRYAQQLPPGGSQGGFAAAGRQLGDPYRTQKLSVFSVYVTGRVREPTDRYKLRAAVARLRLFGLPAPCRGRFAPKGVHKFQAPGAVWLRGLHFYFTLSRKRTKPALPCSSSLYTPASSSTWANTRPISRWRISSTFSPVTS